MLFEQNNAQDIFWPIKNEHSLDCLALTNYHHHGCIISSNFSNLGHNTFINRSLHTVIREHTFIFTTKQGKFEFAFKAA